MPSTRTRPPGPPERAGTRFALLLSWLDPQTVFPAANAQNCPTVAARPQSPRGRSTQGRSRAGRRRGQSRSAPNHQRRQRLALAGLQRQRRDQGRRGAVPDQDREERRRWPEALGRWAPFGSQGSRSGISARRARRQRPKRKLPGPKARQVKQGGFTSGRRRVRRPLPGLAPGTRGRLVAARSLAAMQHPRDRGFGAAFHVRIRQAGYALGAWLSPANVARLQQIRSWAARP
jgi:hypothetical protein